MAKIVLSGAEFNALLGKYKDTTRNAVCVRWREFCESIDNAVTTKNLEQSVDMPVGGARTESFYGRKGPNSADTENVQRIQDKFKTLVTRQRLDAKSFFKDHDHHNHFTVTPRKFKQILTLLGVEITDEELASVVKNYANKNGDIAYMPFINETNTLSYTVNEPYTGAKSTY